MADKHVFDLANSVPSGEPPSADDAIQHSIECGARRSRNSALLAAATLCAWALAVVRFHLVTWESLMYACNVVWSAYLAVSALNDWLASRSAAAARRRNLAKWTDLDRARWAADHRRNTRAPTAGDA